MWVRCKHCQARRPLRRHPDEYQIVPRCRTYGCKSRQYRVDTYRQHVERNKGPKATVCRCPAYHFPHRRESGNCEWRPPF